MSSGSSPPGTRRRDQPRIDRGSNPTWRGLQIVDAVDGTAADVTGVVEFRATYVTAPGDVRVLHDRSRFVRDGGRWYYLDADAQVGQLNSDPARY